MAARPRRAHGTRARHPVHARTPEHRAALRCGRDAGRPALSGAGIRRRPVHRHATARRNGSTCARRVRLFLQVVQAVAYAHGRLVVHRDLKPSNILVTDDGQVRLLDFGIAKLLDAGNDRQPGLTELAGRPHTPEYASPEQIAGEPLSTASDIYSLGVVLYELLAGRRPHTIAPGLQPRAGDGNPRDRSGPAERAGRRPSQRKLLRGDLDTIVLKTLKKRWAERYATVDALGDDLHRWLEGLPVLARPDSARYRLSKFVRRHAIAVAAATVVVASLAAFGVVSAWQARVLAEQRRVAQIERDTAEQVVRVLIDLFQTINPSVRPDGDRDAGRRVPGRRAGPLARAAPLDAGRCAPGCSRCSASSIADPRPVCRGAPHARCRARRTAAASRRRSSRDARVPAGARRAGGGPRRERAGANAARGLTAPAHAKSSAIDTSARRASCTPWRPWSGPPTWTRPGASSCARSRFDAPGCGPTIPPVRRCLARSAATTRSATSTSARERRTVRRSRCFRRRRRAGTRRRSRS